eukprot:Opistho-1_new@97236
MATVANMPPTEPAARYQSSDAVPAPSSPAARLLGDYRIVKTLGEGTFAKVKLAVHVVSQMKVAIKVIDKRTISDKYVLQNLHREAQIMKRISHPNVIRFYEEIETDNEYCLVMEHAGGGEILDYIVAHGKLSEKETRRFIRQVVSAVEHLHQIGIVHRDLKAENLLLDDNMNIKIIDFGLSNNFEVGELLRTRCGSFEYTAPELIASKAYVGPGIDVWTIGVNLYAMLTGCLPFVSDNVATIYSLQVAEKYDVPHDISPGCRAFLKTLLTVDPTKRPSIGEVRMHPWLNKDCEPLQEWKGAAYDGELDALNEDVIARLVSAGFDREKVIRSARGNACNREAAAYRLLKQSPLMRSSSGSRTAAVPPRKAHSVSTADAASTSQRHSVAGVPHPTRPAAAYPAISGNASIAATSAAKREKEIIVGGQVARGGLASLLDDEDDDNNVITSGMPQRPPVQELPEPRRRAETADNTVAGSKRRSDSITSESSLVSETIEDLNVSGNAGSRPVSGRRPSNENSLPQIDGATGSSPATCAGGCRRALCFQHHVVQASREDFAGDQKGAADERRAFRGRRARLCAVRAG